MEHLTKLTPISWVCHHTWKQSAYNTLWCLIGCASGDFATIYLFQIYKPEAQVLLVMGLAMINGLLTSVLLETVLLARQMLLPLAVKTALGMSLVSMLSMELAMNITDYLLVGSPTLTWWSIVPSLIVGFITPWPYNYWRLKKYGRACH